jgi:hypothetical protein
LKSIWTTFHRRHKLTSDLGLPWRQKELCRQCGSVTTRIWLTNAVRPKPFQSHIYSQAAIAKSSAPAVPMAGASPSAPFPAALVAAELGAAPLGAASVGTATLGTATLTLVSYCEVAEVSSDEEVGLAVMTVAEELMVDESSVLGATAEVSEKPEECRAWDCMAERVRRRGVRRVVKRIDFGRGLVCLWLS